MRLDRAVEEAGSGGGVPDDTSINPDDLTNLFDAKITQEMN